jgi:hypothetical protein
MNLWNATSQAELDAPTSRFDNCGFKKTSYFEHLNDKSYIMPSLVKIINS